MKIRIIKNNRFIYVMLCLFVSVSYMTAQSQMKMDGNWYRLYSYLNSAEEENTSQKCRSASSFYAEIKQKAVLTNTIQIVNHSYNVEGKDQSILSKFSKYGNIILDDQTVSVLGLVIPSPKIISSNCTVTLAIDDLQICTELSDLQNLEIPNTISKVLIGGLGSVPSTPLVPGDVVTIPYHELYGKNLVFEVEYDTGIVKQYDYRIDYEMYDYNKCGPPPTVDPIIPENWPPIVDPSNPISPPYIDLCCTPPPPTIPEFTEDCMYMPDEEWEIVASIMYDKNHPISNLTTNEDFDDYIKYSSAANPGVYEGFNGPIGTAQSANAFQGVLDAAVYINPERDKVEQPIIIADGIDFFSNRTAGMMLQEFGGNSMLQLLFDGGYDLIIADFRGGADFIQKNSFAMIELLKKLKDEGVEEIPAVIGPSMGGQIFRYSLLYWEKHLWGSYGDYNIKTFLSADSPWQGANAAPTIQCFANYFSDRSLDALSIDQMANAPAARQMLIHQVFGLRKEYDTYSGIGHPYKGSFYSELRDMGDYPKETNIISIADGGNGGSDEYESGNYPDGNENMMRFNLEFLGYPFNITGSIDFKPVGVYEDILDYDGPIENLTELLVQFDEVECKGVTIENLDAAPGSPFALEETIGALGNSGFELFHTFCFVPTFSALGIDTDDASIDVSDPNIQSPYFSAVFFDDTDSDHNDFTQEGSLLFFLEQIQYQGGQSRDVCEFLEDAILQGEPPILPDGPIVVDAEYVWYDQYDKYDLEMETSFWCEKDSRLIDLSSSVVFEWEGTFNILEDPCGVNPAWNFDKDELYLPSVPAPVTEIDCVVRAELCYEHPLCPSVDIPCKEVIINHTVQPEYLSYTNEDPNELTSTNEIDSKSLKVYPNPSSGWVVLDMDEGLKHLEVYNAVGEQIKALSTDQMIYKIKLESGVFILKVFNENTDSINAQVVIVN